jgi:hypothetical protein
MSRSDARSTLRRLGFPLNNENETLDYFLRKLHSHGVHGWLTELRQDRNDHRFGRLDSVVVNHRSFLGGFVARSKSKPNRAGTLFFFSFWPAVACLGIGAFQVRARRRGDGASRIGVYPSWLCASPAKRSCIYAVNLLGETTFGGDTQLPTRLR